MERLGGTEGLLAEAGFMDWRNFAGVYGRLGPPLRPTPADVANFRHAIAGSDSRVLLLGVTPELSVLGEELTAVDNSPRMIEAVWPGARPGRRALLGDWTDLPFADASFDAVVGDGSLNSVPGALEPVLREVRRVLAPGGRAAFRVFCSPEEAETLDAIGHECEQGWRGNFHALKWRIAMALADREPDAIVPVATILDACNALFPDRAKLASLTGWNMDEICTIDAYVGAGHSLQFPRLGELAALAGPWLGEPELLEASDYPLAERCPTIVWRAAD